MFFTLLGRLRFSTPHSILLQILILAAIQTCCLSFSHASLRVGSSDHSRSGTRLRATPSPKEGSEGEPNAATPRNAAATTAREDTGERSWRKPQTYTIFRRSHDKQILAMAIPSYMAVFLDPIAALIDVAFIGRLPEAGLSLAGVGIGNAINNYFVGTFFFIAVTTTTCLAQGLARASARGSTEGDRECSAIVTGSMKIAFGIGCVMASVAWAAAPKLAGLLASAKSAAALPYAIEYLRAKAIGIPLVYVYFSILGIYRGYQDLATPLVGNAIFCALKVALGYIFLFPLNMGLRGTGMAEAVARFACIAILTTLLVLKGRLFLGDVAAPVKKSLFVDLLAPGGALTSRKLVEQLSLSLTTKFSASFGPATVAAAELTRQCYSVLSTLWWPLSVAGQTLIAAALAQWATTKQLASLRQARGIAIRCMLMGGMMGGMGAVVVAAGREVIPALMTNTKDLAVYGIAAQLLPVAALVMPLAAVNDVAEAAFVAAKDYRLVLRGMLLGALACGATLYLGTALEWGFVTVWIAIGALTGTRALVSLRRFNSELSSIPPTRSLDRRERDELQRGLGDPAAGAPPPAAPS